MIDLAQALAILDETADQMESINARSHSDPDPHGSGGTKEERADKARVSATLQLISTRLELAASLVRIEYWFARGETDPLNPERRD